MALVHIVYAPTADKMGPDLERMGRVEEMPADLARMWLNDGTGREPTADEVAEYEAAQQVEDKAADADLGKMLKGDLEKLAADLELDVSTAKTKADLVAAIEAHRAEKPTADAPAGDVNPDSAATGEHITQPMVVTDAQGNDVSGTTEPGGAE